MTAIDTAAATLRLRGTLMVAGAALCWSIGGLLQRLISADALRRRGHSARGAPRVMRRCVAAVSRRGGPGRYGA